LYREAKPANEISKGSFRISDMVSIHTKNSVYFFMVIDPVRAYGLAAGGVIGSRPSETFVCPPTSLKPGCKAKLLVQTASGSRFITTSTITRVELLKND
jgi:hypothetical protein